MDKPILYGALLSPFVRKVMVFAREKGIEFEMKSIALGDPDPGFRAASPFGKMPALVHGDFSLADSSAIVQYLEALQPEPALIPAGARPRGQVIWFDEFADTILFETARRMFFNRVVLPLVAGRPGDAAAADKAEAEEMPPILDWLETQIPDSQYLVLDRLTLADIAVASALANVRHASRLLDDDRYAKLRDFAAFHHARPSFAGIIAAETRFLDKRRAATA
ncbi:glutathione S-transferase family protein [Polymorphobacter sp.]|uniref:glutathione S-transferase family protein n=1 Tax=Polymorphobacter sp. TaxID=1909290 RepID=UPI003F6FCC65